MGRSSTKIRLNFIPAKTIYLSDDRLDPEHIFHRIRLGKRCRRLFLIALSEREGELFTIYPAREFLLPVYDDRSFVVAGIGKGRRPTLRLLEQMIMDMYKDTKTIDASLYFHP